MESPALSGSSKRAKAPGSIAQIAHCLVDGCNADLSQCREYHRRHKICESHSKTPKVTIGGREQRFCQQCSRFHSLVEFDEGKRSCRKRLDGHNRRRRKPQSESLSRNPGLMFPNEPGARLLSFGSPEPFTSSITNTGWAGVINSDKDMLYSNQTDLNYPFSQNSLNEGSSHEFEGINQFQFLQSTECSLPEVSTRHPLFGSNSASASSSQKIFSDGSSHQVVESDRALSLLSSGPSTTRDIGLSHLMIQPDHSMHHSQQPLANHSQQHFSSVGQYLFSQDIESKPVVSETDSQISNISNLHFQEMFQNGPDGSSTSGSQQTLKFMWE